MICLFGLITSTELVKKNLGGDGINARDTGDNKETGDNEDTGNDREAGNDGETDHDMEMDDDKII